VEAALHIYIDISGAALHIYIHDIAGAALFTFKVLFIAGAALFTFKVLRELIFLHLRYCGSCSIYIQGIAGVTPFTFKILRELLYLHRNVAGVTSEI
jgi:hypothetical protein